MGCCSIGAFKDFDVIVIGAIPTGISVALHCISYGALTALVDAKELFQPPSHG